MEIEPLHGDAMLQTDRDPDENWEYQGRTRKQVASSNASMATTLIASAVVVGILGTYFVASWLYDLFPNKFVSLIYIAFFFALMWMAFEVIKAHWPRRAPR